MAKKWAAKEAFTIIELLVSIVVIGILATIMIVSYTGVQQRARDSQRDSDITQLKIAIEKYRADQSKYPGVCAGDNSGCTATSLATELGPYLKQIPHDPRYVADSSNDYKYVRSATQYDAYALLVHYEAKDTCKTGQNVSTGWWGIAVPTC
ncbi:type II secretion system protein GspG [Candidatus Saccharibacteria bacterium]|nr:type II secretion system protein GspG [Candidatus Saccharibacteria bacterium]